MSRTCFSCSLMHRQTFHWTRPNAATVRKSRSGANDGACGLFCGSSVVGLTVLSVIPSSNRDEFYISHLPSSITIIKAPLAQEESLEPSGDTLVQGSSSTFINGRSVLINYPQFTLNNCGLHQLWMVYSHGSNINQPQLTIVLVQY